MAVQLDTSHGTITIRLYVKETPRTCRNFIELAKHGYYDGIVFHRVVPDFVAQTGDPYGDGHGGESIYGPYFDDEISARLSHDRKGTVSMANAGRNTNSSQFFLTFKECPHLDGKHTVFGYVTEDCLPVLDDIQRVKCKNKKPVDPGVKIFTAQVLENPWQDEALPPNTAIPEKPLVQEKKKCVIQ